MNRSKTYVAAACMAIVALTSIAVGSAVARPSDLNLARGATGRFHDISVAEAAGYGLPPAGAPLHECITNALGTMGFHWVNGSLLDTTLDPARPEALVYQPDADGELHLGALEYVVFQAPWDAAHAADPAHFPALPTLFGRDFAPVNAAPGHNGNTIFDIPPFYQLHVWLWNSNPSGLFFPWNPSVSCAGAAAAAATNPAIGRINRVLAASVGRYACRIHSRAA
jgi:hypothetical protein